ncbi:Ribosomal RNA-processing protein 7 [Kalmanozyma brasiliensis GHG001]|uniref:RRM domain-containing protein n=1 Tax=Kalmanozyma brasiliensis (strain GHG001) TaxID=1365824 RepID=V5EKX6_KALBG|nr:Ribosomal RNA-processing protein 7 [Kalmanozyma brasiliensis GHG001]EST05620.1 Ribosomal RNA-processing protein 7 [Kalmanozyma brasiliensis GHG001]
MGKTKKGSTSANGEASKPKSGDAAIQLTNGFLAVPLAIPHTSAKHWLYVRQHAASQTASSSKLDKLPADRTLFMANLPVDADEEWVRGVFGKVGGVSSVKFRRQAVADEEDEREMVGEGESGSEAEEEEEHQLAAAEQKGGKKKKGKQQERKSRVPRVTPLPSLDPREAAGGTSFLATASSAHVVFLDGLTLTRAMEALRKGLRWPTRKEDAPPTGLTFLLQQHTLSRPALPAIAAWANSTIALHTYRVAHPAPRRLGVRGVTLGPSGELLDEDGFIIVQRSSSSKYGRVGASAESGGSVGIAKGGYVEGKNGKRKSEGLQDFYRFQLRERKRDELKELRIKFERDRAKVAKLKEGRRFKPY